MMIFFMLIVPICYILGFILWAALEALLTNTINKLRQNKEIHHEHIR